MNNPIYIIGGGESLKGFDFISLINKTTIAINKSIFHVTNADYFITIDYSFLGKIRHSLKDFKRSNATKIFVANYDNEYIKDREGKIIDTRWNLVYDLRDFHLIIKSKHAKGIGFSFKDFRSGYNSAGCALQFAVLMGYNPIYLLGIDLVARECTHYHDGYGDNPSRFNIKLNNYYNNFSKALQWLKEIKPEIKVYSCSSVSRLNDIIEYKPYARKN